MTFTLANDYVAVNCGHDDGGCGVEFAMTQDFYRMTKRAGRYWYCPNGHRRFWTGTTTEKELEDAKAREVALRDQLRASACELERTKGQLLRDRHRFANGVCPCCNRSFGNVRRHMESQHPDYDITKVEATAAPEFACSCGRRFGSLGGLHRHQNHNRSEDWYKPGKTWGAHLTKV